MSSEIASKRYAKALFEIGVEKNIVGKLRDELETFKKLSGEGHFEFLQNPVFADEEKKRVMNEFFAREKTSEDFRNFFTLLITEKRTDALEEIYDYYLANLNDYEGESLLWFLAYSN